MDARLCLQDIDWDRCVLTIHQTKFAKSRLVPFGPKLAARLKDYLQKQKACHHYISQALRPNTNFALWNCNRLIKARKERPDRRLEAEQGFQILSAIQIEDIAAAAHDGALPPSDWGPLLSFLTKQWPRVSTSHAGDIS